MLSFFTYVAIYICLLIFFSLYRSLVGPTVLDRLIGVNAIGSKTVVLLLLIGILYQRLDMFIDIALAYALLNFISVVALARYFHKKRGLYKEGKDVLS